jgi:hypothetical protein
MELFMKKILYFLFFLSLKSICASDAGPYELTQLTDEDLAELGILNLPPDPAILSGLPYNSGMGEDFHELNPLQEEDLAALGFLDSAAYTVTPSDLQRAVSMGNFPQGQAAWTDYQDFPANALESGEESAPGPMRHLRKRRKVQKKEEPLDFFSEDEEEFAKIEKASDSDYDDRLERASSGRPRRETKKNSPGEGFECLDPFCSQTFRRKGDMDIHYRKMHAGELTEQCEKCKNYYAADKSDLAKHIKVCGNEKQIKNKKRSICPYSDCGRVYKNDEFLKAHIARDHAQPVVSTE